jgi:phosphoribosylformylglycinamidine synthase
MKVGIVVFPGSNCDHDCEWAFGSLLGAEVEMLWHKQTSVEGFDCIVLPGGFSYGDYLRTGAIARLSPIMRAVERYAAAGGPVIGICNGFQILVEARLLPGALRPNSSLKFRCQDTYVRVERNDTPFTCACEPGQVLRLHIAHYEGNYFADAATLDELEAGNRVVFRYCAPDGSRDPRFNPNGSLHDIAGICSSDGHIVGLMPHPERCMEAALGSADGEVIFRSILQAAGDAARPDAAAGTARQGTPEPTKSGLLEVNR